MQALQRRLRPRRPGALLALFAALLGACGTPASPADEAYAAAASDEPPSGVYALVLGTAQDAGLPQVGCFDDCCRRVRRDPAEARLVTSVLIADERTGKRWLLDCTPDIEPQVARAQGHPASRRAPRGVRRPPLFDGVFLTHAHIGHYTGLLELGPEGYGSRALPVFGSESMQRYLTANDPWAFLVETGAVELRRLRPGERVELGEDLTLSAFPVPHRDELTDTLAFRVDGPARSLLYLPDIDKWERWSERIEDRIAEVDAALLDGAFFADGEIPGRSMADIPHPFIEESLARFAALPDAERAKVLFTHLNHTNPAADPTSAAAERVRAAGMAIAREGQRIEL
ncbi:MAG: MBL fold metallo-hydrolase [Planctomycetota bacterium]